MIQRYSVGWLKAFKDNDGEFVRYEDHMTDLTLCVGKARAQDEAHPFNVFRERDQLEQSLANSVVEERRLRELHQQEFSRAEVAEAHRDHWKSYAEALQRLHDSGGAVMEPALAREVDELREKCI